MLILNTRNPTTEFILYCSLSNIVDVNFETMQVYTLHSLSQQAMSQINTADVF